ncbi:MAG: NAD(+) synthase [Candidatus Buchananbacteria bacterium]
MYRLTEEMCERVADNASQELYRYCRKNGIHYLITGNSGGRDSANTLGLAQRACNLAAKDGYLLVSIGVLMQCASQKKYTAIGRQVNRRFRAEEIEIDLTDAFELYYSEVIDYNCNSTPDWSGLNCQIDKIFAHYEPDATLPSQDEWTRKITRGNIMARLRMITLFDIARKYKTGMVLSTDNLSEFLMGFSTLHGDVGDFGMIQNMFKGLELEDLAIYQDVPGSVLKQKPDDGLGITKEGDAGQLGAAYPVVDEIIIRLMQWGFNPDGSKKQLEHLWEIIDNKPAFNQFRPALIHKLAARSLNSAFKRKLNKSITLSRKQLGLPKITDIAFC